MRQSALAAFLASVGERESRAAQVFASLYRHGEEPSQSAALSSTFRKRLAALADTSGDVRLASVVGAADGTRKLLFTLLAGEGKGGTVEAVLIPSVRGDGPGRLTLCISSQLGCSQNCSFCLTGLMGLRANLSAAQIVGQVLAAKRLVAEEAVAAGSPASAATLSNVVFMGMGEPLHNLEPVLAAVDILLDEAGFAFSRRRVTVSTSGLVPAMRAFLAASRASLAVSLNATTDEVRSRIMPINRKHNLAELLQALRDGLGPAAAAPHRTRDAAFLEYVLLSGVNDTDDDIARLVSIAVSVPGSKVNLITFNPHAGSGFAPSPRATALRFRDALAAAGVTATLRESRGDDAMAACGQLGRPEEAAAWKPPPPRPARVVAATAAAAAAAGALATV